MTCVTRLRSGVPRLAAVLLLLADVPTLADTPAPIAPRWSSSALQAHDTAEIEAALQRSFPSAFRAIVQPQSGRREIDIDTCKTWQAWKGQVISTQPPSDFAALRGQGVQCDALVVVLHAQPARHSALPIDLTTLIDTRLYPATLWLATNPDDLQRLARSRSTLASVSGERRWRVDRKGLLLEREAEHVRLVWLARADFDGDGWEDALYRWQGWVTNGTWSDVRLVMLTRRSVRSGLIETPPAVRP